MKFNKYLSLLLVTLTLTGCNTSSQANNNNQNPNIDTNQPTQNGYVRVTTNLDDFTGEYLIVGNDEYYLNPAAHLDRNNFEYNFEANVKNDCIERRKDGRYSFLVSKNEDGTYKFASKHNGQVMGASRSSSLEANPSFTNSIDIDSKGHAIIKCNGFTLRFSGEDFRYYTDETIFSDVYLFKY